MDNVWVPPPEDFVKINVFEAVPDFPLANGNTNGIGIIIRDHNGFLLWGTMGPVHGLSHYQSQLWAIHKGMKESYARGRNNMLIETEHTESFRILKRQSFEEASQEGLVDAIQAINACNPLIHSDHEPICRIYSISEERNQAARFAAEYGMFHHSGLVNLDYSFVALRNILDNDIGWGPHIPHLDVIQDHGDGEVIQGPKPKKRKRVVLEEQEYADLLKLNERVARLESLLESQLQLLGAKEEAFSFRADPVFAFKASLASPPLRINEGGTAQVSSGAARVLNGVNSSPRVTFKDKGKSKMFPEDSSNYEVAPVIPPLVPLSVPTTMHIGSTSIPSKGSPPASSSNQVTPACINTSPFGMEGWDYLYDSLFSMIDPPLGNDNFMSVEEAMIEMAMLEEIMMRQNEDATQENK